MGRGEVHAAHGTACLRKGYQLSRVHACTRGPCRESSPGGTHGRGARVVRPREHIHEAHRGWLRLRPEALMEGLEQRRDGLRTNRHGTWYMVQGKQRPGECTGA